MHRTPHVYLIPGFLGFANLGQITYFGHVRRMLTTRLAAVGFDARIHIVHTPPTASLPRRAARVAATIAATASDGGPLHLIGHSSGGLDARLFTAPEVALPSSLDVERLATRVRSVVTIATPHHGTPLASFFTTLRGQQLLQLLSLLTIYVLNFGHLPLAGLLWMGSRFVRLGDLVANSELLDELFGRLLEDFTAARRRSVRAILRDVVHDQALMLQLTPEAMDAARFTCAEAGIAPGTRGLAFNRGGRSHARFHRFRRRRCGELRVIPQTTLGRARHAFQHRRTRDSSHATVRCHVRCTLGVLGSP
jgi:hypothetical protein